MTGEASVPTGPTRGAGFAAGLAAAGGWYQNRVPATIMSGSQVCRRSPAGTWAAMTITLPLLALGTGLGIVGLIILIVIIILVLRIL
jgi:hypothetical protein